jgi:uncharacterized protein YegL
MHQASGRGSTEPPRFSYAQQPRFRIFHFQTYSIEEPMSSMQNFTVASARPLPVIVLADCSGSMSTDGKIAALNQSLAEMIRSFSELDAANAEVHLCVIGFGDRTGVVLPLQPAAKVQFAPLPASGGTPLGAALNLAAELLEDRGAIPSRAYRPTVILVSDGQPTDEWKTPLGRFGEGTRAGKADRMALGIGADADIAMLQSFLGDLEKQVFKAADAAQIRSFFKFATMSVTQRSKSANPSNIVHLLPPADLDQL